MNGGIVNCNTAFLKHVKKCRLASIVQTKKQNLGALMVQAYGNKIKISDQLTIFLAQCTAETLDLPSAASTLYHQSKRNIYSYGLKTRNSIIWYLHCRLNNRNWFCTANCCLFFLHSRNTVLSRWAGLHCTQRGDEMRTIQFLLCASSLSLSSLSAPPLFSKNREQVSGHAATTTCTAKQRVKRESK